MPKDTLRPGLTHTETILVTDRLIVPEMADYFSNFAGMPPVLATAYLVAFVEWTCVRFLAPHLLDGEHTVGTHVDLSHTAATPVGMRATAAIELVERDGRKLRFKVSCRDERDAIGAGFHERVVIDGARFLSRLAEKRAARP
ncbi:MAG TPA: thioesterase family protein [Dongiaceae bacterium]|jgi:fluoroacetyl-CoA thioesterase|nr:thioesterase family protein [Dongiaceae bacterium]